MGNRLGFDPDKFKHVSSDENQTILKHKDGHSLIIAHRSLSPKMREQLSALSKVSSKDKQEPESKASGGSVESGSPDMNMHCGGEAEPKKYAEGDIVESAQEQKPDTLQIDVQPDEVLQEQKLHMNPEVLRKREIYNNLTSTQGEASQFGPQGEEPAQFDPTTWQQAEQGFAQEKESNAAATAQSQQQTIAINQQRVAAGLPPLPVPNVPNGPQIPGTEAEQGLATTAPAEALQQVLKSDKSGLEKAPQDSESMYREGVNTLTRGINAEAKAKGDVGAVQAEMLQKSIDAKAQAQTAYKQAFDGLTNERQGFLNDLQQNHISPEQYWTGNPKTGEGGHSKLASVLGIILAGFNPTNRPNAAFEMLKYQMDKNMEAQKENMGKQKTLLEANFRQFGNLHDATDMTRLMQNDIMQNELSMAAAKSASPVAKAAAQQAIGKLQMDAAPILQKFAMRTAMNKLQESNDPAAIEHMIAMMQQVDPEQAKQLRDRFVPGAGLASTAEGAKTVRETRTMIDSVKSDLAKLKALTGKTGKSFSLTDRASADILRKSMVGALRIPITGPGSMSEGERQLLLDMVPDPTSFFTLDTSTMTKLNALEDKMNENIANTARANGLSIKGYERNDLIKGKDGKMYRKAVVNGKPGYVPAQ